MKNNSKKVNIIVVTWNNEKEIAKCLDTLLGQSYSYYQIIVVDNNSSDQTKLVIKNNYPQVILIENPKNIYYTGGLNTGIKYSEANLPCKYYLIMNPDVEADSEMLTRLVNTAEADSQIALVGPKIKFLPKESNLIYSAGVSYDGFNIAWQIGHKEKDQGQYDQKKELSVIEGTCMLIRSSIIKETGYFWEKLKMYSEDVEFCIRVKKKGYKIVYEPQALLFHHLMRSTSQNKSMNVKNMLKRNWLLIILRHNKWKSKIAIMIQYVKSLLKSE